jgi:hypothetical protein
MIIYEMYVYKNEMYVLDCNKFYIVQPYDLFVKY